jgi:hypothetical protein
MPATTTPPDSRPAGGTTSHPAARHGAVARLLAALRGDKYMVDAYPSAVPPAKDG